MALSTRLGVTRSKATSLASAGLTFHAFIGINQARPPLAGVVYKAVPVLEDHVTLYSFKTADACKAFIEQFGATPL
jgi:hypothetical protein